MRLNLSVAYKKVCLMRLTLFPRDLPPQQKLANYGRGRYGQVNVICRRRANNPVRLFSSASVSKASQI